jgi:Secretion system C-terminal sorting domain
MLKIYTNPSTGLFTLAFAEQQNVVSGEVEIYNVMGQKIETQCIASLPKLSIDLTDQPNGVYFYRVISGDGNVLGSGKMIVQK